MAESTEVQALEKITSEVDESQIKVILSTQCIKAQAFLTDKLRKQAKHLKETYGYISSANMKLQSEITQSEQKLQSMILAQDTIKMANVELKKQYLVAKERKVDVIDRIAIGETKYDEMWEEAKSRYESLPFVQELLKAKEKEQALIAELETFENIALTLVGQIENKTKECIDLDRKRIIEFAQYIVHEMPKIKADINEKTKAINELLEEMKQFEIDCEKKNSEKETNLNGTENIEAPPAEWPEDNTCNLYMPKLQLPSLDFDVLSVKLDEVKIKRANSLKLDNMIVDKTWPTVSSEKGKQADKNKDDTVSSFFNEPTLINITEERNFENYSKKKLINILEDVKLDPKETLNLISNVNVDSLNPVNTIDAESAENKEVTMNKTTKARNTKPIENNEIEEIDMSGDNILNPPTPFLDMTLIIQGRSIEEEHNNSNKQEECQKNNLTKKVSFDLRKDENNVITNKDDKQENMDISVGNITEISQLEISVVSECDFEKMKDVMLRKHEIDLSPEFVYAKNPRLSMNIVEQTVTSKFFQQNNNNVESMDIDKPEASSSDNQKELETAGNKSEAVKKVVEMTIDEPAVSSPKRQKMMEVPQTEKPLSGLLFSHGAQAIPESLDVSISTTGFEEGDADFPHCIDSSLLLSPKADIPMPVTGENTEGLSQEVPNFLSGLRKTGLSFFGRLSSTEPKPDSSVQNQGAGFSFNFGGEDKKNRSGLFSMFK